MNFYGRKRRAFKAGQATVPGGGNGCGMSPAGINCSPFPRRECLDVMLPIRQNVAANTRVQIVFNARRCMCPRRFEVSPAVAGFFDIFNLLIGDDPQFSGGQALAADMLLPDSAPFEFRTSCVFPGMPVTVDVQNLDPANARNFSAKLLGTSNPVGG